MRIHTENAKAIIRSLAVSIARDPASLEAWRCLHIAPQEDDVFMRRRHHIATYQDFISEHYGMLDCELVVTDDGDLLIISKSMDGAAMRDLADLLINQLGINPSSTDIVIYDLFRDWRAVRDLLLSKGGATPEGETTATAVSDAEADKTAWGELDALRDVFQEARKLRAARKPAHVLLVEDDPVTRRMVANIFKDRYALITAQDAQEAIVNYMLHAPDIVFLDINLPDIDGIRVLRRIIASDPDAYVVMFSGNSYLDNITTSLEAGASGFVPKPFSRDKMAHYIADSEMHHRKHA